MLELHDVSDAIAYGFCIYMRSVDQKENVQSYLLSAKSKVFNPITVAKLELCGAILLLKLLQEEYIVFYALFLVE